MLPRCGRVAHICEANQTCIENRKQKSKRESQRIAIAIRIRRLQSENKVSGAIAIPKASWGCAPALPNWIRVVFQEQCFMGNIKNIRCNCSTGTVARHLFSIPISQGGAVLFAPPRKAVAFLTTPSVCQKHGTGISLPAGSDQGCLL